MASSQPLSWWRQHSVILGMVWIDPILCPSYSLWVWEVPALLAIHIIIWLPLALNPRLCARPPSLEHWGSSIGSSLLACSQPDQWGSTLPQAAQARSWLIARVQTQTEFITVEWYPTIRRVLQELQLEIHCENLRRIEWSFFDGHDIILIDEKLRDTEH
jgi:hypothetical protein